MENTRKIEIDVDVKAEDYRRVLFWYNRIKIFALATGIFITTPAIIWLLVFVEGANKIDSKNRDIFSTVIFYGLFVLLPIFLAIILYSICKQSKKLASISEAVNFVFDANGLESKAESTTTKSSWERFAKICETKTDFIFFPQENIFYPIPKRFFKSENQIDDLKKLVKEKLGKKAKLQN